VLRQRVRARFASRVEQKKIRLVSAHKPGRHASCNANAGKKGISCVRGRKKYLAIVRACAIFRAD
jgi:hypothetical protein